MRISLPANYDPQLLPQLKQYSVYEIYGKLPYDVVGGGRPTYMATPMSRRRLGEYIAACHANGLEFNYLINAACLGNNEWTRAWQRGVNELLEWLTELKVDTLTVAVPFLLQMVKQRYPHFKTKVGIYAQVDTVKRAQYWESLGADGINLESFSINRDLAKLARIREAVKADIILIANHFCQPNCAFQVQHQVGHAHASNGERKFLIDYPLLQCNMRRYRDPTLFIAAGWIRPEDLHVYEDMGIQTYKLIERNIPSEDLLKRARAYHERHYEGNLAELLLSWGFKKHPPAFSWLHMLRTFGPWRIRPRHYRMVRDFLQLQGIFYTTDRLPVTIDAGKIPADFIERFRAGDCCDTDCTRCGYCGEIAAEAVRIEPAFLERVLPLYEQIESTLVSGDFWDA